MRVCLFRHSREKPAEVIPAPRGAPNRCTPWVEEDREARRRTTAGHSARVSATVARDLATISGTPSLRSRASRRAVGSPLACREGGGCGWPATVRATARRAWSPAPSPAPSAAPCSRSRSPRRCSASATTTHRSSPASAGWCPTTSTSSSRRPTSSGWRRTTRRWCRSSPSSCREHAEQQHYVFPGPVTIAFESADDLTTGRFRIKSRAQAAVTGNSNVTQVAAAAGAARGQRHPSPADAARAGHRARHRGRPPHQRPRA